jgi:hypothetical protein
VALPQAARRVGLKTRTTDLDSGLITAEETWHEYPALEMEKCPLCGDCRCLSAHLMRAGCDGSCNPGRVGRSPSSLVASKSAPSRSTALYVTGCNQGKENPRVFSDYAGLQPPEILFREFRPDARVRRSSDLNRVVLCAQLGQELAVNRPVAG